MLTPTQEKILELLEEHREGLTTQEIRKKTAKNPGIPADELNTALRVLVFFRFIRSEIYQTMRSGSSLTRD